MAVAKAKLFETNNLEWGDAAKAAEAKLSKFVTRHGWAVSMMVKDRPII